jgi:hypothetical protein
MSLRRLAIFLPLLIAASAWSQSIKTVGIPSDSFDYVASMQEAHEWCWAASTQMVLKWFGVEVTQEDVVHRIKGRVVDQAASAKDIMTALNTVAQRRSGNRAVIHAASVSGPPHPQVIINQLSQQVPMLFTIDTGPNSGHVVVLTGARYYETEDGPHISSLIIRDPYPSPSNLRNQGRIEISGRDLNRFVQYINRSWMVWITPSRTASSTTSRPSSRL